ncbi:MAG: hypothetical protein IID31_12315 [Planctomycetes bacterium]|nr:hypothetical protein [Planctomycetota bacterium]
MPDSKRWASGRGASRGGVSPVLVVLLVVLIAAAGAFFFMRSQGKSAEQWRTEIQTQYLLGESLEDADEYFGKATRRPAPLDPSPNLDEEGNPVTPNALEYIYTVTAGDETIYVLVRVNIKLNTIIAMIESDADGVPVPIRPTGG